MKVVIDVVAGRLAIEGDGPELLKVLEATRALAPEVRQIQIVTTSEPACDDQGREPENRHEPLARPPQSNQTLRQFVRSLSLNNSAERIAAIGYYVNKIEGRPSFSPKDIDGWFTMCGFQKPSQISVAVFDAKRKYGFVESAGRGCWRISNQGENLIIGKLESNSA
jgi:hypothetical protein